MSRYTADQRKRSATVKSEGKAKFPIHDKAHARLALEFLDSAKPPLTAAQKAKVRKRAASFGVPKKTS